MSAQSLSLFPPFRNANQPGIRVMWSFLKCLKLEGVIQMYLQIEILLRMIYSSLFGMLNLI